jgi:hypothetical protein
MKKRINSFKKIFNRYVNGTRGVISIFLTIVMLPFMSTALIMVESARYQSAIQLVDELLDSVGLSSLADMDGYLEHRFGVLAMAQNSTVEEKFSKYMQANTNALNSSFDYISSSVKGAYSLADPNVLKKQIMDYSEINTSIENTYDTIGIDDWLKALYERMGVEKLNNVASTIDSAAMATSKTADLINTVKGCVAQYQKLMLQTEKYELAQQDFLQKASELIIALNNALKALPEGADKNDIYKDAAVQAAVAACEKSRDAFKEATEAMSEAVEKMESLLDLAFDTANKITTNVNKTKNNVNNIAGGNATGEVANWVITIASEITNTLKATVNATYNADMAQEVRHLDEQAVRIGKVVCNQFAGGDKDAYYIDADKVPANIATAFPIITLRSINSGFDTTMLNVVDNLNQGTAVISNEESANLTRVLDIAAELLKVTAFFDGSLDAHVSPSSFYKYNKNDVSLSSSAIITSLTSIVQSGTDLVTAFTTFNIFLLLKAIVEFLVAVVSFIVALVAWVVETCINLGKFVSNIKDASDTLQLASYLVYTLPNRTNYYDGENLDGFLYKNIFHAMGGKHADKVTGSMKDYQTLMADTGTGTDGAFYGAEVEYMLAGTDNELLNQAVAFGDIYMFRLICDLQQIFSNEEVHRMAATANIAGWIVYVGLIIAEPMIDTLMLVNGQTVCLYKKDLYLTPSGIPYLLQTLPSLTGLSDATKEHIKAWMIGTDEAATGGQGKFPMDYKAHLRTLLLLTTSQATMMSRLQNLIQMEGKEYYKNSYNFSLDNAYTYVEATVKGKLNAMFDIQAFADKGPLQIEHKRYIGY